MGWRDNIEVFNIEWHNIPGKEIDHVISSFAEKNYLNFLPVKQVVYLLMNLPSG